MGVNKELVRRINAWLNGEQCPPYMLTMRPTWKCNLSCKGCTIPEMQKKKLYEATSEYFLKIVDEAAELGVRRIEIVGSGEPLCKKGIFDIIRRIKQHGIECTMTTNCTLFTEHSIKEMIEIDFDLIAVSLDGPNVDTHDYLRGAKGTFTRVVKNLEKFKELKESMGRGNPEIILVPFLNKVNYKHIEDLIKLGKELGVNAIEFKTLVLNEKSNDIKFSEAELSELPYYAEKAKKTAEKIGMKTNVGIFINKELLEKQSDIPQMLEFEREQAGISHVTCFRPFYHLGVSPNGEIYFCQGELFDEKTADQPPPILTLSEVWYGQEAERLREAMKRCEVPEVCKICCGGFVLDDWNIRSEIAKSSSKF